MRILFRLILIASFSVVFFTEQNQALAQDTSEQTREIHEPWDRILQTYRKGSRFRYRALKSNTQDLHMLHGYLQVIANADLKGLSKKERFAFWINAYNANVVGAVVKRYPIDSVMKVDGFFDKLKFKVAGKSLSLNQIEKDIIRKKFGDPRVHFALNCASRGCPPLAARAFSGKGLSAELERLTRKFIRQDVEVEGDTIKASKIFEWYAEDFRSAGGVHLFIGKRQKEKAINSSFRFVFREYDWSLNE